MPLPHAWIRRLKSLLHLSMRLSKLCEFNSAITYHIEIAQKQSLRSIFATQRFRPVLQTLLLDARKEMFQQSLCEKHYHYSKGSIEYINLAFRSSQNRLGRDREYASTHCKTTNAFGAMQSHEKATK